jgi:hypothetical protein
VTDVEVTVTDVVSDEGTTILFAGVTDDGLTVTFAADHPAAAAILEALRAGQTPVVDVPSWTVLGCPIVTCEGYGASVNYREEGLA